MKRRRFFLGFFVAASATAYLASPFLAAFEVRQAMKQGDKSTLERRVEWAPVRASLKASIAEIRRKSEIDQELAGVARPSIWSRMKAMVMPTVAETFVDSYVTAEGVIQLFAARATYKDIKKGLGSGMPSTETADNKAAVPTVDDHDDSVSKIDRFRAFYARIRRAEFRSPTEVEFEIADRTTPDRRFISTFELKSFAWKLTGVKVAGVGF
jgi:Protein of unknown function (DUF2939)